MYRKYIGIGSIRDKKLINGRFLTENLHGNTVQASPQFTLMTEFLNGNILYVTKLKNDYAPEGFRLSS